jgi:hypothetical protein
MVKEESFKWKPDLQMNYRNVFQTFQNIHTTHITILLTNFFFLEEFEKLQVTSVAVKQLKRSTMQPMIELQTGLD